MKISKLLAAALLLTSGSVVMGQTNSSNLSVRNIEFGVKGGATFTHGFTTIPGQTVGSVQVPQLDNQNNGVGYGYSGGLWARKNFSNFFIQAEVT